MYLQFKPGRFVKFNWKKYWYVKQYFSSSSVLSRIYINREVFKGSTLVVVSGENYSILDHQCYRIKVKNLNNNKITDCYFDSTWFYPIKGDNYFINLSLYI